MSLAAAISFNFSCNFAIYTLNSDTIQCKIQY